MITRIMTVEDVQGRMIRKIMRLKGEPLQVAHYQAAHVLFLRGQPGSPVPHRSEQTLLMEINNGRWITPCPECMAGVTTFRLLREARCFGCGAIFTKVVWPQEIDKIEAIVLRRFPINRNWSPNETIDDLLNQNRVLGVK